MKKIVLLIGVISIVMAGSCKSNDAKAEQVEEDTVKSETSAPDFVLSDAEDKPFRLSDNPDKTVVLCFLKKMSKKNGKYWLKISQKWMRYLQEKNGDKIVIIGLIEMTNIPVFLPKSFIRSRLKKQSFRFLIDWKGKVFAKYPSKDLFTLYVVNPEMKIVYKISKSHSDSLHTELFDKIQQLIEKGQE